MIDESLIFGPSNKGFYQVGHRRFFRKLEAIEYHLKTNLPLSWNYNESVYDLYDWTVEPAESIDDLYKQHALTLRERYDYLILWYSAGADSDNILNTFINHDICLDEVASYVNYDATGDKLGFLNGEIYNVAIPWIQQCQQRQPWLKHTMIDLSQATIDYFSDLGPDWIYNVNSMLTPNTAARQNIKKYVPAWQSLIDSGKKVGFIYGIDKPRVTGINGNFYFRFTDLFDQPATGEIQAKNAPGIFDEYFYWNVDTPKMLIKQGHLVKNFMKTLTQTSPCVQEERKSSPCSLTIDGVVHWIQKDCIHKIIYPNWRVNPYQVKTTSSVFSPRDYWFYSLPDSDPAKLAWKTGVDHIWSVLPDSMKVQPDKLSLGMTTMISKVYYLGS